METTFVAMLEATSAITALVGSGANARIYPLKLPQSPTFPAITYQVVSVTRGYTQDGADGLATARIQANLYSLDYAGCIALRDAMRDHVGGILNMGFGSPPVKVQGVFLSNERDTYEEALDELPDGAPYRKSLDISFNVEE